MENNKGSSLGKKKLILLIAISIISICSILLGVKYYLKINFTIPDDYIRKDEDYNSYMDGSDADYYIYDNKVIVDTVSYFPDGLYSYTKERTVTLYNNLNENEIKNYKNTIYNKKGKVLFHSRN